MKKSRQMDKPPIPICRICGTQFNLMHVLQGGQDLIEKLWLCANIKIDFEGDLPKHICLKCEQGLNFSYRLRKQGEAMELRLRQQQQENNTNEVNLTEEIDDVEDALQEFKVANSNQAKTNLATDEVQIIEVKENVKVNQDGTLRFDDSTTTMETRIVKTQQIEVTEIISNPMINVNNMFANLMPIHETSKNTDVVQVDDDIYEEFVSLEDNFHKKVESNIDSRHGKVTNLDEQDNDVEIIEDVPLLNQTNINSIDQFDSNPNVNDIQQYNNDNDEYDDVEIIADSPPSNTAATIVNSNALNLSETPNYDLQQQIVEYLERSRPVTVKIVKSNATLPQVQKPQNHMSYMQQDAMVINKETTILNEALNDVVVIDNDFDIIDECEDTESCGEYEDAEAPEESFEFETLEKYKIDLEDVVNVATDTTQQETSLNAVVESNTLSQNRNIVMNTRMAFKCDTCSESFPSQSQYRFHIKIHGRERYNCSQCKKWFPSRYRLKQHERVHSNVDMYNCEICENTYRHRQNLKRHLITAHVNQKLFNCNQCDEVFARPDILKNHMTKHISDRNFNCELCSKSFKSNFYLMSHKRSHHLKENGSLKRGSHSAATGTGTSTSDESSNPSYMENTKRTFYCIHCGKISKHHFAHKNHLRTHTFETPYECEFCKKKFRTLAARITHERIHTDDRPYQCERCYQSFRQSSHLKDHMLIHDGIMSHVCNICNMAFTKKSNMKVHMRVHTGERPYKCAEIDCGQQFSKLAQLKRHAAQTHARNVEVLPNEEDDELSSGNETEPGEFSDRFESEELDVGIVGAEETAIELVNDSHYKSLYIFDEIGTS